MVCHIKNASRSLKMGCIPKKSNKGLPNAHTKYSNASRYPSNPFPIMVLEA